MDARVVVLLVIVLIMAFYIAYQQWFRRKREPRAPYWEIKFTLVDGAQKVRVTETIFHEIKVWLRGEGDNLYEIASDDGYLCLRRAHIVCATGRRK